MVTDSHGNPARSSAQLAYEAVNDAISKLPPMAYDNPLYAARRALRTWLDDDTAGCATYYDWIDVQWIAQDALESEGYQLGGDDGYEHA